MFGRVYVSRTIICRIGFKDITPLKFLFRNIPEVLYLIFEQRVSRDIQVDDVSA